MTRRGLTQRLCGTLLLGVVGAVLNANTAALAAEISTVAGTGQKGYSGDGGPATEAQLNNPFGLLRGPDGALYVCDTDNHRIRKIAPNGIITTVAGNGQRGYSGDGGPATDAAMNEPYELRFDAEGHLFIVERLNHLIRRVDAQTGVISTVAGTGKPGFSGDGGPAKRAQFNQPHSIQFGTDGQLYVCDVSNHRVRKIDLQSGLITTFAGDGQRRPTPDGAPVASVSLNGPRALDRDADGNFWLALREGNAVYRIDMTAGTIHHMAGTGKQGFTGNGGPARQATLAGPKCVSVAPDGRVYLADTESHSIRMIDPRTGKLHLIAGTGQKGDGPNGNPLKCRMGRPHGVFVDQDGAIFIGDSEAHQVRVVK